MPQKKGALDRIRDRLQANRNRLTYVLLLLGGLLGLAGWALLPEVVAIHAQQAANIGKNHPAGGPGPDLGIHRRLLGPP